MTKAATVPQVAITIENMSSTQSKSRSHFDVSKMVSFAARGPMIHRVNALNAPRRPMTTPNCGTAMATPTILIVNAK